MARLTPPKPTVRRLGNPVLGSLYLEQYWKCTTEFSVVISHSCFTYYIFIPLSVKSMFALVDKPPKFERTRMEIRERGRKGVRRQGVYVEYIYLAANFSNLM